MGLCLFISYRLFNVPEVRVEDSNQTLIDQGSVNKKKLK